MPKYRIRLPNDSPPSGIFHYLPRCSNTAKRRPELHGSAYRGNTKIDWSWPLASSHEEDQEQQTSGMHSVRQRTINAAYRHLSGPAYRARKAGREGNTCRARRPVRMRCLRPTDAYARRTSQSGPLRPERNRTVPRPTPVTCGMPTQVYRKDTARMATKRASAAAVSLRISAAVAMFWNDYRNSIRALSEEVRVLILNNLTPCGFTKTL